MPLIKAQEFKQAFKIFKQLLNRNDTIGEYIIRHQCCINGFDYGEELIKMAIEQGFLKKLVNSKYGIDKKIAKNCTLDLFVKYKIDNDIKYRRKRDIFNYFVSILSKDVELNISKMSLYLMFLTMVEPKLIDVFEFSVMSNTIIETDIYKLWNEYVSTFNYTSPERMIDTAIDNLRIENKKLFSNEYNTYKLFLIIHKNDFYTIMNNHRKMLDKEKLELNKSFFKHQLINYKQYNNKFSLPKEIMDLYT